MGQKKNKPPDKKEAKEREWADLSEQTKFVIHGGKVQCAFANPPIADIIVTSNTIMLQDKPFATTSDNDGRVNFNFTGVCMHPSQQRPSVPPPPCKAVINTQNWEDYSDSMIGNDNALLVKSTIRCGVSMENLTIMHSGQMAMLSDIEPVKEESEEILAEVVKISGPTEARPGKSAEYKVTEFNKNRLSIPDSEIKRIGWTVFIEGGGQEKFENVGEEFPLEIKREWANKEITVQAWLNSSMETAEWTTKIGDRKIVIVIDPGHGVRPAANTVGSQARLYRHRIMEVGSGGRLTDTGLITPANELVNVEDLPFYVLADLSLITERRQLDPERIEYRFAWDIVSRMIQILSRNQDYVVINTRTQREMFDTGRDTRYAINFRNAVANDNEADYFISIHTDGGNSWTERGAHGIYNHNDELGREFATQLLRHYTVVPRGTPVGVCNEPPVLTRNHPNPRTDVGVVGANNNARYKALLELGFMENPIDAHAMWTRKDEIAEQIVRGLIEHIENEF